MCMCECVCECVCLCVCMQYVCCVCVLCTCVCLAAKGVSYVCNFFVSRSCDLYSSEEECVCLVLCM